MINLNQYISDRLKEVWKQYPDWRLGQLLFNITGQYDMFYVEDDTIEYELQLRIEKECKV